MDLKYSAEERLLESSAKDFARDYLRDVRSRSLTSATGVDPDTWHAMIELGWLAAGVSEEYGGLGGSITDALLIHEGMGSGLILEPLVSASLSLRLLESLVPADRSWHLFKSLLDGAQMCAVAHEEWAARGDLTFIESQAVFTGETWTLHGHKCMVLGAPSADQLLVSARTGSSSRDPIGVFSLTRAQFAGRLRGCVTVDGQRAADVDLEGLQVDAAARMGSPECALPALVSAFDRAILETCADALGAMEASVALTAEHLKSRKQFGLPLASFQALQHKLADMVIATEQARSILLYGISGIESRDDATRARAVSAARVRTTESARTVGTHAIQLHGGIGVTEEHIISHYYRRLVAFINRFGGVDWHLARFITN